MLADTTRAEVVFLAALDRGTAEERAAYIETACAGSSELLSRVRELLKSHEESRGPLDTPPPGLSLSPVAVADVCELLGTTIGPYKLREVLGEGGMGTVYVAEQERPVRRRVALKVIKPGMDTREVLARFQAERQALALMDHPHIARVLEAGATDAGRPYFVMELVRGVPITDYCDQARLSIPARLELFVKVCQAVQHAHQKGIIHRDLKPSNVLVTLQDGIPVPKVIDFGVAKAINQRLGEHTVYTRHAQMLGSPLYMSPEQAALSGLDVDTRSDVYSLGALLYELLTGTTPFDRETLSNVGIDEIRRIIREQEPSRPSQRLSTLAAAKITTVLQNRSSDQRRLQEPLRGELDWIVMKALEKDRTRRYESASAFAADIERYLRNEPVDACPPSAAYRLSKLTHRHRVAMAAAAAVLLAMFAGTAVSVWQATEADTARKLAYDRLVLADDRLHFANRSLQYEQQARQEAETQRQDAQTQRQHADEQRQLAQANFQKAREAVDEMLTRVADDRLSHIPGTEAIRRELLEDALRFYEQFLEQRGNDRDMRFAVAQAWQRVGYIRDRLGSFDEAVAALEHAIDLVSALCNEFPDDTRYHELVVDCADSILAARGYLGPRERERPSSKFDLALASGLAACRQLQRLHPENAVYRLREAQLRAYPPAGDDTPAAFDVVQSAVQSQRELLSRFQHDTRDHVRLMWSLRDFAHAVRFREPQESVRLLQEAAEVGEYLLRLKTATPPARYWDDPDLALAQVLFQWGRLTPRGGRDREALFRRAIALAESFLTRHPENVLVRAQWGTAKVWLGQSLAHASRWNEAQPVYRQSCQTLLVHYSPANATPLMSTTLWQALEGLAAANAATGQLLDDEMRTLCYQALCRLEIAPHNLSRPTAARSLLVATLHKALNEHDRERESLRRVVEDGPGDLSGIAVERMASYLMGATKFRDALKFLDRAIADNPGSAASYIDRAKCQMALQNTVAAYGDFDRALELAPNRRGWVLTERAFSNMRAGHFNEALNDWIRCLEWNPKSMSARKHRAQILVTLGRLDEALSELEAAVEANPGDPSILEGIMAQEAAALADTSFPAAVLSLADRIVEQAKGSADARAARGMLHAATGNLAAARGELESTFVLSKADLKGRHSHALVCLALGDEPACRADCAEMVRLSERSHDAQELHLTLLTCALIENAVPDWAPVLTLADRELELSGRSQDSLVDHGATLLRAGRFAEALRSLDAADVAHADANPSAVCGRYFRAMAHSRLGDADEARKSYAKALELTGKLLAPDARIHNQPLPWDRRLALKLIGAESALLPGIAETVVHDIDHHPATVPQPANRRPIP